MANEVKMAAMTDLLHADAAIVAAIVFGSAARGQLRADSDLDLAVLYVDGGARQAAARSPLLELGRLGVVAGRDVHLIDLRSADSALRRSIFASGTCLFDRSNGALRNLEHRTMIEYVDWEYARRVIDAGQRRRLGLAHG
jgi:predicted nucleotidyltransferase